MKVALITIGDELLSGDIVNTNANWLATQLTDRGVLVTRIIALPDDREIITNHVSAYSETFDSVIVTGGIGGTPDDVTIEAVANAFDQELTVSEVARSAVEQQVAEIEERLPDRDFDVDIEAEAALPERSRPLLNDTGLSPGCILKNVYVLPGIPDELKAMFAAIADEFTGELRSTHLYTAEPEANIVWALEGAMERFEVTVGCYPDREAEHNRLKITAADDAQLDAASDWLLHTIDASETPVSRDYGSDNTLDSETN